MPTQFIVKSSQYFDSVVLMKIASALQQLDGIEDAALVMGTAANKALLQEVATLSDAANDAKATDLILLLVGEATALEDAVVQADTLLNQKPSIVNNSTYSHQIRSLKSAQRALPTANMTVISLPAEYAVHEAWSALRKGLHVLLFSDNVSLEDERQLKEYAVAHNLLLMGPGAGTAIINGVGLGFANSVPRGPVGIVSAAGTGLQEVSSILAQHNVGISQAIGVGGRDLSNAISGLMTFQAIEALQADSATDVLIVISKLPAPHIAERVMHTLANSKKPAIVIFMTAEDITAPEGLSVAQTLQEAALMAVHLVTGQDVPPAEDTPVLDIQLQPSQQYLRGLFSGGTLCEEAMRIWSAVVGDVWSNAPLHPHLKLANSQQSHLHSAIDLGEEEFTVGRPHPMIDNSLRIERLLQESRDPAVAVVQLDVVLGYGAHPNPAAELGPAIQQARQNAHEHHRELPVVVSITGSQHDPQNYQQQKALLEQHGATVFTSNAAASHFAVNLIKEHVHA